MSIFYNGIVEYEKFRYLLSSILFLFLGLFFIFIGINTYFNPPLLPPSVSDNSSTNLDNNTQSTKSSHAPWYVTVLIGIILIIFSFTMFFIATNNSQINNNFLATQAVYNRFGSVFIRNNGGYFTIGE
jgi:O-antigen/teichoic acid export membrane protein